jgi:hypothetical protein
MMMLRLYTILERKTPPKLKNLIPQSWRIKLGYQIKVAWRFPAIKMDFLSYPLALPAGETEKSILDCLSVFYFEEDQSEEFRMYLKVAFKRFLYTLQIIPPGEGRLLEIGASPYFASMLLWRFTRFGLTYVNYFGPSFPAQAEQVLVTNQGERVPFPFYNTNVETEPLPFSNEAFIEQQFTSDVHANTSHLYLNPKKLMNLVLPRKNELGQYIFVRAKNDGEAVSKKPDWLYRSYPSDELVS